MKTLRIMGITAALLLAGCGAAEVAEPTQEPTQEPTGEPTQEPAETPQAADITGVDSCAAFFDGGDDSYEQKLIRLLTVLPEQPRQSDFKTRADMYSEISAIAETAPVGIGEPMQDAADSLKPFYDAVQDQSYSVEYAVPDVMGSLGTLMLGCADAGYQISD